MAFARHCRPRWFAVIASLSLLAGALVASAAPALALARPVGGPALTGSACIGSMDKVSWNPVAGALSYRIVQQWQNGAGMVLAQNFDVPKTQTSVQVPVKFGPLNYSLYWAQAQPPPPNPPVPPYVLFGSINSYGFRVPTAIQWDSSNNGPTVTGNGSVTISFLYPSIDANFFVGGISGGVSHNTIAVTASPGGQTISSTLQGINNGVNGWGVTDTFNGLTNGIPYTFTSTSSNQCGTSTMAGSPPFTPRAPGGLYCVVTGVLVPPAVPNAQQMVQVLAADGLASITNIQIVNGTVSPPFVPPGITDPITVTATKTTPGLRTTWSFDMTDVNGKTKHCT